MTSTLQPSSPDLHFSSSKAGSDSECDQEQVRCIVKEMQAALEDGGLQSSGCKENARQANILADCLRTLEGFVVGEKSMIDQLLVPDSDTVPDRVAGVDEGASCKQALVDAGGIGLTVRAMKEYSSDAAIQRAGCSVLYCLWDCASGKRRVLDEGGLTAVLQGMNAHVRDSAVQRIGFFTLKTLSCLDNATKQEVLRAGGLTAIVTGMRQHLRNTTLQISGCQALGVFACPVLEDIEAPGVLEDELEIAGSEAILNGGGIAAMIGTMRAHRSNCGVQKACLSVMEFVCRKSIACQIAVINHCAVIDVVSATKLHPGDDKMKTDTLWLLSRIAKGSELGQRAVAGLGAMDLVVRALQEEPGTASVKCAACSCLVAVAGTAGSSQSMNTSVAGGSVRALVAALKSPSASTRVTLQVRGLLCMLSQCTACSAIGSGCGECGERRRRMVSEGVLDASLASLKRSKASRVERTPVVWMLESLVECVPASPLPDAQELVLALVTAMGLVDDETDAPAPGSDPDDLAERHLLASALTSASKADTHISACYALVSAMQRDASCRKLCVEAGGVRMAVEVATALRGEVRVQSATCMLLSALVEDKELAEQLMDPQTGALQVIVAAMNEHCSANGGAWDCDVPEERPDAALRLQRHGLTALTGFLRNGDRAVRAVLEAGAGEAVMRAMASHEQDEAIVNLCFQTLGVMVWVAFLPPSAGADGVERELQHVQADAHMLELMTRAMKQHPSLRDKGMGTLHAICEASCSKRQEQPRCKRQRTAEELGKACAQATLRSLPAALLGQLWPAERVGIGSQVCRWLRDDLAGHAPAVTLSVASGMHPASPVTPRDVCSAISRYQRGAVTLQCFGNELGDRADEVHFVVDRLFPSFFCPLAEQSLSRLARLALNNGALDRPQASLLGNVLSRCPGLVELCLSQCQMGWEAVEELGGKDGKGLAACEQLAMVNLSENGLGDKGAMWVGSVLGECKALSWLDISGNRIGQVGASALAAMLAKCPLESLYMGDNKLRGAGTVALCAALPSLPKLRVLCLSSNSLGSDRAHGQVDMLAQCLRGCELLEHLNLSNNGIGDEGGQLLAGGIAHCSALSFLALGNNSVGDASAAALVDAMKDKKQLTHLDLEANAITDRGVKTLANMIASRVGGRALKSLSLEDNKFGDDGATSLASALPECPELEELYLSGNTIGDSGVAVLAKALMQRGKKLEECSLEENAIGDEGFRCLLGVVQAGKVRRLLVNGNQIGSGGVDALLAMLHSSVESPMADVIIDVSANPIDAEGCVSLIPALANCQSPPILRLARRYVAV